MTAKVHAAALVMLGALLAIAVGSFVLWVSGLSNSNTRIEGQLREIRPADVLKKAEKLERDLAEIKEALGITRQSED